MYRVEGLDQATKVRASRSEMCLQWLGNIHDSQSCGVRVSGHESRGPLMVHDGCEWSKYQLF